MTEFVKVARAADIPPGTRKLFDLDEISIALFNIDGQYYCIEDVCTHDGAPVAEGDLDGFEIECPRHGALFDIRDGRALSMPAVVPVPKYEVKVVGDDIYIELPDDW